MGVILKPTVKVGNIQIQADTDPNQTDAILDNWGPSMPVFKINDYVLSAGEVISFEIRVRFNSLPSFTMEVDDMNFTLRKALNGRIIDVGVVFIGFKTWYIKFNCLMTVTVSDAGDRNVTIDGILWNPPLHDTYQKGYTEMSVTDIITDVCKRTGMGLFTIDGPRLAQQLDTCLNAGMRHIDFFNFVLSTYTNCLWCIDPQYIWHVVDFEQARNQPLDKYTLDPRGNKLPTPLDMVLTTATFPGGYDDNDDKKLQVKWFTINTNFGQSNVATALNYRTFFEGNGTAETDTPTTQQFGTGTKAENSFYGFSGQYFPHYPQIVNKLIAGRSITAHMENIIFELTPFSVVNFEAWMPRQAQEVTQMDTDNSGKKIVIGYTFTFDKATAEVSRPLVRQTIDMI
jgi:hypothetical protein